MWVIEMLGYMPDIAATGEREPLGRISVLEDLDDDGRMDRKTVFLDKLVLPRALKVLEHGVLVAEPPNLWLARDTDGDLRADTKELVTNTYGRREANVEHNANSLVWALDNWMHTSESDVYLRLKNNAFEVRKTLARGQWGASQDDAGRIYRNSNESVLHVDLVPTPYYARNPNLVRTRGSYESLRGDKNEVNTVWPAAADAGRQPRLPGRRPPSRRPARLLHGRQLTHGLPRRPPSVGSPRQRLRRRSGRQRRQPDHHSG